MDDYSSVLAFPQPFFVLPPTSSQEPKCPSVNAIPGWDQPLPGDLTGLLAIAWNTKRKAGSFVRVCPLALMALMALAVLYVHVRLCQSGRADIGYKRPRP